MRQLLKKDSILVKSKGQKSVWSLRQSQRKWKRQPVVIFEEDKVFWLAIFDDVKKSESFFDNEITLDSDNVYMNVEQVGQQSIVQLYHAFGSETSQRSGAASNETGIVELFPLYNLLHYLIIAQSEATGSDAGDQPTCRLKITYSSGLGKRQKVTKLGFSKQDALLKFVDALNQHKTKQQTQSNPLPQPAEQTQDVRAQDESGPAVAENESENDLYLSCSVRNNFSAVLNLLPPACELDGLRANASYELLVEEDRITAAVVGGPSCVTHWPYCNIRRHGWSTKNTGDEFWFEAGRRCPSGEGLFTFKTPDAQLLFRTVELKKKSLRQPSSSNQYPFVRVDRLAPSTTILDSNPPEPPSDKADSQPSLPARRTQQPLGKGIEPCNSNPSPNPPERNVFNLNRPPSDDCKTPNANVQLAAKMQRADKNEKQNNSECSLNRSNSKRSDNLNSTKSNNPPLPNRKIEYVAMSDVTKIEPNLPPPPALPADLRKINLPKANPVETDNAANNARSLLKSSARDAPPPLKPRSAKDCLPETANAFTLSKTNKNTTDSYNTNDSYATIDSLSASNSAASFNPGLPNELKTAQTAVDRVSKNIKSSNASTVKGSNSFKALPAPAKVANDVVDDSSDELYEQVAVSSQLKSASAASKHSDSFSDDSDDSVKYQNLRKLPQPTVTPDSNANATPTPAPQPAPTGKVASKVSAAAAAIAAASKDSSSPRPFKLFTPSSTRTASSFAARAKDSSK